MFRVAALGSHVGIQKHGLLTAQDIAERAGIALPNAPRQTSMTVTLPDGTAVIITENRISLSKLADVLDDDLTPLNWLAMLNARVFFWPHRAFGKTHLQSRLKLGFSSEWQIYDTLRLLRPVWDRAEIAPINSGSTLRKPARRGRATFAPLDGLDYGTWRKSRGKSSPDVIKELTIRGSIPNAGTALISSEPVCHDNLGEFDLSTPSRHSP